MPASKKMEKGANVPPWVFDIGDYCLKALVGQAYIARAEAVHRGAAKIKACAPAMKSGDDTLEQVRRGNLDAADCGRVSAALRAFSDARACALGNEAAIAPPKRARR